MQPTLACNSGLQRAVQQRLLAAAAAAVLLQWLQWLLAVAAAAVLQWLQWLLAVAAAAAAVLQRLLAAMLQPRLSPPPKQLLCCSSWRPQATSALLLPSVATAASNQKVEGTAVARTH
jgi:4-amino-4-deoxy-L-arabinose transferase-like glycosyltransferase